MGLSAGNYVIKIVPVINNGEITSNEGIGKDATAYINVPIFTIKID